MNARVRDDVEVFVTMRRVFLAGKANLVVFIM